MNHDTKTDMFQQNNVHNDDPKKSSFRYSPSTH